MSKWLAAAGVVVLSPVIAAAAVVAAAGRQAHHCTCGHPRLVHLHMKYTECLRCWCSAYRRRP